MAEDSQLFYLGRQQSPCGYCRQGAAKPRQSASDYFEFEDDIVHASCYDELLDAGIRRCGRMFYKPVGSLSCCSLRMLRVQVERFVPSRNQRGDHKRGMRHVGRIETVEATQLTTAQLDEELALFLSYQQRVHSEPDWTRERFVAFLVDSAVSSTVHQLYYSRDGALVAVGVVDVGAAYVSAVYFFYDTLLKGVSLGTMGAIEEIGYAKRCGIPFYTLGYYNPHVPKLAYKARFAPAQTLSDDLSWTDRKEGLAWHCGLSQ